MKTKLLLILTTFIVLTACVRKNHAKHYPVKCYQTQNDAGDILFWYILMSHNSSQCYYYSSPTQVTNFSNIQFTNSSTAPIDLDQAQLVQEVSVPIEDFSNEMQTDFAENAEYFGGLTESEMGDYEGTNAYDDQNGETGAGNDAGDGGGGDSGGDGGGGGE